MVDRWWPSLISGGALDQGFWVRLPTHCSDLSEAVAGITSCILLPLCFKTARPDDDVTLRTFSDISSPSSAEGFFFFYFALNYLLMI